MWWIQTNIYIYTHIYIYIHPPKNGYYFASPWIFLKCGKELPSHAPQRSSVGIIGGTPIAGWLISIDFMEHLKKKK